MYLSIASIYFIYLKYYIYWTLELELYFFLAAEPSKTSSKQVASSFVAHLGDSERASQKTGVHGVDVHEERERILQPNLRNTRENVSAHSMQAVLCALWYLQNIVGVHDVATTRAAKSTRKNCC